LAFASGSSFIGGPGGNANTGALGCGCGADGGFGGTGFTMASSGSAWHLDDDYAGGSPGAQACGSCGGCGGVAGLPGRGVAGKVNLMAGVARHAPALEPVRESQTITLALHGKPGDAVWLMRSSQPMFRVSKPWSGVLLAGSPLSASPLGTYDANGDLVVNVPTPLLAAGDEARVEQWQTAEFDGAWWLGPPLSVVVLDDAF
jgi:hypothetical protein